MLGATPLLVFVSVGNQGSLKADKTMVTRTVDLPTTCTVRSDSEATTLGEGSDQEAVLGPPRGGSCNFLDLLGGSDARTKN